MDAGNKAALYFIGLGIGVIAGLYFAINFYTAIAVFVYHNVLILFPAALVTLYLVYRYDNMGTRLLERYSRKAEHDQHSVKEFGVPLVLFLGSGWLTGNRFVVEAAGEDVSILFFLGVLAQIVYAPALVIFCGFVVGGIIYRLPFFTAASIAATTHHPATGVVKRSARRKRGDERVERRLGEIMERQVEEDERVARRFASLNFWQRWKLKMEYRARADKASDLEAMLKEKRDAYKNESSLGMSMHEHERAKRRR